MIEEEFKGLRGYRSDAGIWYPAVGTILDILHPAPMEWIAEEDLAAGAACHKEMEQCLTTLREGGDPYEQCSQTRVRKFLDWFTRQQFTVLRVEFPALSSIHRYVGRADVTVLDNMLNGHVLEVKFAESANVRRYHAQVEGYIHTDNWKGFRPWIIQVTRAGKVIPHPRKPDPIEWAGFLGALSVLNCRLAKKG